MGGDAALDALEACSGKASSAVIMKKARMRMRACGSLRFRQVEGSFGAIDESHRAAKVVKDIRRPRRGKRAPIGGKSTAWYG
jgi:hypothetical protein